MSPPLAELRVAIIHYWLIDQRGGEKVLDAICELFPQADIYTHVVDQLKLSPTLRRHSISTTFIAKLPFARKFYSYYLPFMPMALEQLDLSDYDLVISSESGPAKGVLTRPDALHVCYCHTPMRYIWDLYQDYRARKAWPARMLMTALAGRLRIWDVVSSSRVDHFIANSEHVAERIRKIYRRSSTVIYPPVDTAAFKASAETGKYYLMMGNLAAYKRADLAVEAFNQSGRHLIVIGDGELYKHLKRIAGPTVKVIGKQPFSVVKEQYSKCRALIHPGVEDFGIVPLEAMAAGRPVIAYRAGGALETVVEGLSGMFFDDQTVASLNGAMDEFELRSDEFSSSKIQAHAATFDVAVFKHNFKVAIDAHLADRTEESAIARARSVQQSQSGE